MGNREDKFNWETNFNDEFATVDSIKNSGAVTAKTDAFILTWVKAEKQARKIFTHLVYQIFPKPDVIREVIHSYYYFDLIYLIRLFDALHKKSFAEIVGDEYTNFLGADSKSGQRERIRLFRNKILHGQLTDEKLDGSKLENETEIIRNWIKCVAEKMNAEVGYDGFGRNSFTESNKGSLKTHFNDAVKIDSKETLKKFIEDNKKSK